MHLWCKGPDGSSVRFELRTLTRIGRSSDNEIQLFDSSASAHHCEIRVGEGVATVHDLGSTNGIAINGEPVQQAVLHPGNVLKVGETEFLLENEAGLQLLPSE